MKIKNLLSSIFLFCLSSLLFAGVIIDYDNYNGEDKNWNISLKPAFGMKYGTVGEYVFITNPVASIDTNKTPDDKLSYLEWEVKPVLFAGLTAEFTINSLFADLGFTAAIPDNCGSIHDYDWRNIQYACAEEQQKYCTNYSCSDNYLDSDLGFSVNLGYSFKPWKFLKITPVAGYEFSRIKFTASGGEYWYGKDIVTNSSSYEDDSLSCGPFNPYDGESNTIDNAKMSGTVLEYLRQQYTSWVGLDLTFVLPAGITLSGSAHTSPFIYTYSEDSHPLQTGSPVYVDISKGFFSAWKFKAAAQWMFTKHAGIYINGQYSLITEIRGDSYGKTEIKQSYTHYTGQQGGADCSLFQASAGVTLRF